MYSPLASNVGIGRLDITGPTFNATIALLTDDLGTGGKFHTVLSDTVSVGSIG